MQNHQAGAEGTGEPEMSPAVTAVPAVGVFSPPSSDTVRGRGGRRISVRAAIGVAALLLALALPLLPGINGDLLHLASNILLITALAQGWNIIGGYTGYAAFGNVVFYGLGAYSTAVVMNHGGAMSVGMLFVLGLLVGAVIAALFAAVVGVAVLRLRGHYFAIATLGVAVAAQEIFANFEAVGGASGISLPIQRNSGLFYYLFLALVFLAAAGTWLMERRRLGYALLAIRENEGAAEAMGIHASNYKVAAFVLSAVLSALVGGVYAYWSTFIDPPTVFNLDITVQMILVALLGGAGTVWGPLVGALVFEIISQILEVASLNLHNTLLGIFVIMLVLFVPRGLAVFKGKGTWKVIMQNVRQSRI